MSGNWLDLSNTSNRYIQMYVKGFIDMSGGNLLLRPNSNLIMQGGDISLNGNLYAKNVSGGGGSGVTLTNAPEVTSFDSNSFAVVSPNPNYGSGLGTGVSLQGTTMQFAPISLNNMGSDANGYGIVSPIANQQVTFSTTNVNINGNLNVGSNLTIGCVNLTSAGAALQLANITVTSNVSPLLTDANGCYIVTPGQGQNTALFSSTSLALTGNLTVGTATAGTNAFVVAGNTALVGNVSISNDLSLNGRLFSTRDISLNGNLNIGGNLSVSQFSSNKTITTTNYQLIVSEDLSLNGRVMGSSDASFAGSLWVGGGNPTTSLPTIAGSGTYITSSLPGNYAVYTFTSGTSTFTPTVDMQVGYIVVGGGGSSGTPGGSYAGGGGGGGVVYSTYSSAKTFTAGTTYTITVGAGGTVPATGSGNPGTQSSIISGSVFSVIAGGGAGGITNNGGTSAGGSYTIGTGATGSTGVTGITGGTGSSGSAPANGITVTDSTVGISSIFGGGGGGVNGYGSTGGGGYGVTTTGQAGNAGLPNTGGGGGSGWAGGSGVVIIYFSFTSQTYSLNVNNGIMNATNGYSLSYTSLPLLTSNMIGYTVKAKFAGSGSSQSFPGNSMLGSMSIGKGVWLITGTFTYSVGMSTAAAFNLFIQTTTPTAASAPIVTVVNYIGNNYYSSSISTVYSSSITNNIYFYGCTPFNNTTLAIITSGNATSIQQIDNYLYAVRIA